MANTASLKYNFDDLFHMVAEETLVLMAVNLIEKYAPTLIDKINKNSKDKIKDSRVKEAFDKYYKTSIGKYAYVKTILSSQKPLNLCDIFVDLDLKNGEYTISSEDLDTILKLSKKLIVKGMAGCGKSTLIRYLFLRLIEKEAKIPIFIELRNIKKNEESLLEFIYSNLADFNFDLDYEEFIILLDTGLFVVLFDGFDEVPPELSDKLEKEIIRFSDKYYENHVIVTSRPDERFIAWSNFTELGILPLPKDKSIKLVEKIDYDPELKKVFIEKLDKELYNRHESFASNPLLLIVMLMTFSECADVPNKIHLFYEMAFIALFIKHDNTKAGFKRSHRTNLDSDDFKKVLNAFCVLSYFEYQIIFTEEEILKYLRTAKKITSFEFNEKDFFEDLQKSMCLLIRDGVKITFTHRTFQEYFTACYIKESPSEVKNGLLEKLFLESSGTEYDLACLVLDMDKNNVEAYVLKVLKEIKETTKYGKLNLDDSYILFLKETISSVSVSIPSKEDIEREDYDTFRIEYHYQDTYRDILYLSVVEFSYLIYSKGHIEECEDPEKVSEFYKECVKYYLEGREDKERLVQQNEEIFGKHVTMVTINIQEIISNENLVKVLKEGHIIDKKMYISSMGIVDEMEKKSLSLEKTIKDLLLKK